MQISIKTKGPTINGENEEKKIFQIAGENRLILEKLLPHSICGYDLLLVPERLSSGQRTQANKNKNKNKERHTTEHLNLNYISGTHTQYLIYEYATCCLLHTSYDVRISIWKSVLAPTHIYTGILYSFHLVFHFIPMRWKWRAYVSSAEITRELCKAFTAEFAFCACLLQTYIISASGLLTNNIRNSNHFSFRRYIIILIRFVFFYVCLFFFFSYFYLAITSRSATCVHPHGHSTIWARMCSFAAPCLLRMEISSNVDASTTTSWKEHRSYVLYFLTSAYFAIALYIIYMFV